MRTSTYLRVATVVCATTLAACDSSSPASPTSPTSHVPTRSASQQTADCTNIQGTIEPNVAALWPDVDYASISGSLVGSMAGSVYPVSSGGGKTTWEGSYYIYNSTGDGLLTKATIDMRDKTAAPGLEVYQVSGTLTIVSGEGSYVGATGVIELSGMTGHFQNEPKSRSALNYHGTLCPGDPGV